MGISEAAAEGKSTGITLILCYTVCLPSSCQLDKYTETFPNWEVSPCST